jgi:hypothetical protein
LTTESNDAPGSRPEQFAKEKARPYRPAFDFKGTG